MMATDQSAAATSTPIATQGRSDPSLRRLAFVFAAIAFLAAAVVLAWAVLEGSRRERPIGDGHDPASYQFDLGSLAADPGLAASGRPRDYLPSLDRPQTIAGREVADFNASHRRRPVVSSDRVVGVVINGEARAYPVPLLEVHEIVNDELGGVPIAVSFSPLADMAVVYRREIEGEVREFGLSGLMLDATHLLYDRIAGEGPSDTPSSLWSPLRLRSVAGPSRERPLELIPMVTISTWSDWLEGHPESSVAQGDARSQERDRRIDYTHTLSAPGLPFPVGGLAGETLSEEDWANLKAPVLAVLHNGDWILIGLEDTGASDGISDLDNDLSVRRGPNPRTVTMALRDPSDPPTIVIPCMRFAAERLGTLAEPAVEPSP